MLINRRRRGHVSGRTRIDLLWAGAVTLVSAMAWSWDPGSVALGFLTVLMGIGTYVVRRDLRRLSERISAAVVEAHTHRERVGARLVAIKHDTEVSRALARVAAEARLLGQVISVPGLVLSDTPKPAWFRSQYGDDCVVWHLLDYKASGYYVEAGAFDGVTYSNTYFLEQIGWTGLLVEPSPEAYELCRRLRPQSKVARAVLGPPGSSGVTSFHAVTGVGDVGAFGYACADPLRARDAARRGGTVARIEAPACTLDDLLTEQGPTTVDYLSLDVEGCELAVLWGANLPKWRPTVIGVEADREDIREYLVAQGYERVLRLDGNTYYRRTQVRDSRTGQVERSANGNGNVFGAAAGAART